MRKALIALLLVGIAALGAGCAKKTSETAGTPGAPNMEAKAKALQESGITKAKWATDPSAKAKSATK